MYFILNWENPPSVDGVSGESLRFKLSTDSVFVSNEVFKVNNVQPDSVGNISIDTDNIPEGVDNKYFKTDRVRSTPLTGLTSGTNTPVTSTDTLIIALQKLQAQSDEKADANSVILALGQKVDKIAPITAKTVGSATKIPVITYNEQGQVTTSTEVDPVGGGGVTVGNETGHVPAVNRGFLVRKGVNGADIVGMSPNDYSNSTVSRNIVIGDHLTLNEAAGAGASVIDNIAIGSSALKSANSSFQNVAIGTLALRSISGGSNNSNYNVGIGHQVGSNLSTARDNVIIGKDGSKTNLNLTFCTNIGSNTLLDNVSTLTNVSVLGYQADVTGSNQVQLGNSVTTTYTYGSVQNRSDLRDKAEVLDCDLGLNFINALAPKKWKWDYREDYINELFPLPVKPTEPDENSFEDPEAYEEAVQAYTNAYNEYQVNHSAIHEQRNIWWSNPVKDGSKVRNRFHYGFGAQNVKATLDNLGIDWAGLQDHTLLGGKDTLSIGYMELIAPMIKAIQELSAQVKDLQERV